MNTKASNHMQVLASKASQNERFLGYVLSKYATENGVGESDLALKLKCPKESMSILYLCRAPRLSAQFFGLDVRNISEFSGCDAGELAKLIREWEALNAMRKINKGANPKEGILMAARDKKGDLKQPKGSDEDA